MATNINVFIKDGLLAGNIELLASDAYLRLASRSTLSTRDRESKVEKNATIKVIDSPQLSRSGGRLQDPPAYKRRRLGALAIGGGASTPEEEAQDSVNGPQFVDLDISVIDEDNASGSFGGTGARDAAWNAYRAAYPFNKFVLLVPTGQGINVPSNFYETQSYKFTVGRNDSGGFTDWFDLMQGQGVNPLGVRAIHLLVDNSGSMTINTVASDLQNFLNKTTSVKYVTSRTWQAMLPYENWIQMHTTVDRLILQ